MFLFYWWISKLTRKYEIFWQKKTHQMTAGKFVENKALTGQIAWDWRCNSSVGRFQRWFYWGQNHENHPIFGVCVFFWRSFFLRLEIFFSSASCWGAQISMGILCFFWPPFKEPIGGEICRSWVKTSSSTALVSQDGPRDDRCEWSHMGPYHKWLYKWVSLGI